MHMNIKLFGHFGWTRNFPRRPRIGGQTDRQADGRTDCSRFSGQSFSNIQQATPDRKKNPSQPPTVPHPHTAHPLCQKSSRSCAKGRHTNFSFSFRFGFDVGICVYGLGAERLVAHVTEPVMYSNWMLNLTSMEHMQLPTTHKHTHTHTSAECCLHAYSISSSSGLLQYYLKICNVNTEFVEHYEKKELPWKCAVNVLCVWP